MQSRYTLILGVVIALVALVVPTSVEAQTSSINAYSPYSMYGPGELLTPGNVQMRSMGGIGIGMRTSGQVNTQNPAAASITPRKSFLFDFSFDGTHSCPLHLGSYTSVCRFYWLETTGYIRHPNRDGVPSLFHIREQTLPSR